jgi:hypothetical protein
MSGFSDASTMGKTRAIISIRDGGDVFYVEARSYPRKAAFLKCGGISQGYKKLLERQLISTKWSYVIYHASVDDVDVVRARY